MIWLPPVRLHAAYIRINDSLLVSILLNVCTLQRTRSAITFTKWKMKQETGTVAGNVYIYMYMCMEKEKSNHRARLERRNECGSERNRTLLITLHG